MDDSLALHCSHHAYTENDHWTLDTARWQRVWKLMFKRHASLRIELLEAVGLRAADLLSENDVFALFIFEGNVVKTATLEDSSNPRWQPTDGRAAHSEGL